MKPIVTFSLVGLFLLLSTNTIWTQCTQVFTMDFDSVRTHSKLGALHTQFWMDLQTEWELAMRDSVRQLQQDYTHLQQIVERGTPTLDWLTTQRQHLQDRMTLLEYRQAPSPATGYGT